MCDPDYPRGGFAIAAHNVNGRLQIIINQVADVRAAQEGRHPGNSGFDGLIDWIGTYIGGSWSYQQQVITPPQGMTELDFIAALLDRAEFYRQAELLAPVPYGANNNNCNRWMSSFLISLGMGGTTNFPYAFDLQWNTTLRPGYFPAPLLDGRR